MPTSRELRLAAQATAKFPPGKASSYFSNVQIPKLVDTVTLLQQQLSAVKHSCPSVCVAVARAAAEDRQVKKTDIYVALVDLAQALDPDDYLAQEFLKQLNNDPLVLAARLSKLAAESEKINGQVSLQDD